MAITMWTSFPRFEKMSRIDKNPSSAQTAKILPRLPREATSILTQLCTGHIGLNVFLKKINAVDSTLCAKGGQPETVVHYLLHSQRYSNEPCPLKCSTGKATSSISRLLSDPKMIKALRYVAATRRFKERLYILRLQNR